MSNQADSNRAARFISLFVAFIVTLIYYAATLTFNGGIDAVSVAVGVFVTVLVGAVTYMMLYN